MVESSHEGLDEEVRIKFIPKWLELAGPIQP